jgi:hypothetical protein
MKIGSVHGNVRFAYLKKIFFWPPIGDVKLSLLFLHVLCAQDHFQTLYMEGMWLCLTFFFVFGAPLVIAQGASVR